MTNERGRRTAESAAEGIIGDALTQREVLKVGRFTADDAAEQIEIAGRRCLAGRLNPPKRISIVGEAMNGGVIALRASYINSRFLPILGNIVEVFFDVVSNTDRKVTWVSFDAGDVVRVNQPIPEVKK